MPAPAACLHARLLGLSAAVRTRKSTDASRSSTAERHMAHAKQASPAPPASDERVAGSALPSVAPPVCSALQNTLDPLVYVIKALLKYQEL